MQWSGCSLLGPTIIPALPPSPLCTHSHSLRSTSWIQKGLIHLPSAPHTTKVSSTWNPKPDTELQKYVQNLCIWMGTRYTEIMFFPRLHYERNKWMAGNSMYLRNLWCVLKRFHLMEKEFSKPVLSQWVAVQPFTAFLLAWDLISKYKDLDRDLLSNSYIVL